jgi:outer membrane receptor protein involved in Fe transport
VNTKNIWGTKKILLGGAAILALMSTTNIAFAQEDDTVVQTPASQVAEVDTTEDVVVVTGSRIRRTGIETLFPTTTIGEADLDNRAFTNINDALVEIPAFGTGLTDEGAQGGQDVGRSFVDFLDLGTGRTLVLVDGKRFVSTASLSVFGTNGLQVDLNSVPTSLIERVDTIGIGGAPIYGADAIAGTVNVILKDDFEGLEATTQYTIPEAGGAEVFSLQLVAGANFADDKGNVTFSADYETQEGLTQLDRGNIYDPENSYIFSNFASSSGNLNNQQALYNNVLINLFTNGGVATAGSRFLGSLGVGSFPNGVGLRQFDSNGNLVPFVAGTPVPGQSAFFASGGDGSNLFQDAGTLLTPSERIVGTSRFNYRFSDRVSANAEFLFSNTNATETNNQGGFQSFPFSGTSAPATISVNHPLLTTQARDTLVAGGLDPSTGTFRIHRLNNDIVNNGPSILETSLWRFSGGFEGNFDLAERKFFWDVSFTHGESDVETTSTQIIDNNFINALDAVTLTQAHIDAAGGIDNINALSGVTVGLGDPVCQVVIDAAAGTLTGASGSGITDRDLPFVQGCAPLDIFGFGRGSQEALDFVTGRDTLNSDITSQQFVANLSGSLIDLPAGEMSFNIGYERRLESGRFNPSISSRLPLGRSAASLPNAGSFRTEEIYGELSLPLVSPDMNIPLVHALRAEGAYRTIDVSTLGDKTKAFTVGGAYSPIEDITIRGNYTESTRLPGIVNLFAPVTGSFASGADPCDSRTIGQASNVALRTANCAADGIDVTTFISNIQNATVFGRTGGNSNLKPEESTAWTIGADIRPRFLPNFNLQIDYMNVEIPGAISNVTVAQIMAACYDSSNFPNDPNCSNITRDASGQVVDFLTGPANAGLFDTEFLQFNATYFYDVNDAYNFIGGLFGGSAGTTADWGSVSQTLSVFSPLKRVFAVGDEDPRLNNTRGGFTDPNVQANFSTTYTNGGWTLFWNTIWQDNPLAVAGANLANTDERFNVLGSLTPTAGQGGLDANGRRNSANAIKYGDGSQFIHNATISYNLEDVIGNSDTLLQLSVSNVFDRSPSILENALVDFNFSQILGRTFTFRVKTKF